LKDRGFFKDLDYISQFNGGANSAKKAIQGSKLITRTPQLESKKSNVKPTSLINTRLQSAKKIQQPSPASYLSRPIT